ncbi:MAG TPA: UPF0175 family protein [Acetobacteraceae bacterium]|jgi:predicted HTH domain antitoxin|nr:UPF0175 family protein [Acetobacteraceae bacterium]
MNVTVRIPDDLATRLSASGADLERRALEGLALAEYQAGRLTLAELRRLLDLSRYELDGFLKAHGVFEEYTLEDLEQERQTLERLGF